MRKVTMFFLLAATAMPAMAADDVVSDDREQRGQQSSTTSDDRDSHRPSVTDSERSSRQPQVERAERQERVRSDGNEQRRETVSARGSEAQGEAPAQVTVERRGDGDARGFGMRRRGQHSGQQSDGGWQQPVQQDVRQSNGWQPRERRIRSVPDTNVVQQVGDNSTDRASSTYQRRHRDGNYNRWSHQWRNDRRYDWRRHRDRHRSAFRIGFYYDPFGWNYRRFGIGSYMSQAYFGSRYWISDPWQYRLPPAYGPYRWVRYHNDALLIDTWTGEVVDVIYGFFW